MALGYVPEFVMVPQVLPDPLIMREEGARVPMYDDEGWLLMPAAMQVRPLDYDLEDDLDEYYEQDWRRFFSLVGIAFDPAAEYVGYESADDEMPYQPVRLAACLPISAEDADLLRAEGRRVIQGGWWAEAWAYMSYGDRYAGSDEAFALAAREIPAGLSARKERQLRAEAEHHLNSAVEMEDLELRVFGRDGGSAFTREDLRFELPEKLTRTWNRLLGLRTRTLDALPAFVPSKNDLRLERIYHTWS